MNQTESTIEHITGEIGVNRIESSIQLEFDLIHKTHRTIDEFLSLAPLCFTEEVANDINWQSKSAFFIYQQEVFNHAHRSLIEALSAYYNIAFILLRTTVELLLKGSFWECLSHRQFRDNSSILDKSREGKKIKDFLNKSIKASPNREKEFDKTSAAIFDLIGKKIETPSFRPTINTIIKQLEQWGLFNPIVDPTDLIYKKYYSCLSADVHAIPDKTDIGRRIASEYTGIFDQNINQDLLREYLKILHEIMDVAIVVELNILQDIITRFKSAKSILSERLPVMKELGLQYSIQKMNELLK